MENTLFAKDYLIEEYLSDSCLFLVPRYQRSYAWEKSNIQQLLNDIEKEENYYLGNVIINISETGKKEIIDGQQRLISIFLILIALYHTANRDTLQYVLHEGELKLDIERRIDNAGISVMNAILDDNFPATIKKYYEVRRYKDIKSILKTYSEPQIDLLCHNLLNAKIVEIKFTNREKQAHEMFVNLNTKGKPLEGIEIVKSHLFQYLVDMPNSDKYKEEWYEMLGTIGDKYYGKYLQHISLLLSETKTKKNAKQSLDYLLKRITDYDSAKEVFDFMAGDGEYSLYKIYSAVKNHDILCLREYIGHESEISIDMLNNIWRMFGQIQFEQFDIVMVALLYLPDKAKKRLFAKNYLKIIKFLKLLLCYQIINMIRNLSPSSYTNKFEAAAIDIFKGNIPIETTIENLIADLKIKDECTREGVIDSVTKLKCTSGNKTRNKDSRNLRAARYIIQLLDENYVKDLKAEHIIPESEEKEIVFQIGNILPVVKDRYKNKNIVEKLAMYQEDAGVNNSIKKFLELGVTQDNYEQIIASRTQEIATEFANTFEGLKNG